MRAPTAAGPKGGAAGGRDANGTKWRQSPLTRSPRENEQAARSVPASSTARPVSSRVPGRDAHHVDQREHDDGADCDEPCAPPPSGTM